MPRMECNFDGLAGPTHHYAGLSFGNVASLTHAGQRSYPREAVLQGLDKMQRLLDMGLVQGLLPPQARPCLRTLRRLGFSGSDASMVAQAAKVAPALLTSVSSSSFMWAANAATVTPSCDSADGRVHFTPANLVSTAHRSIETEATARTLAYIFPEASGHFVHHPPLPATPSWGDEGAANHMRLHSVAGGVQLFVFGQSAAQGSGTARFPARQSRAAAQAVTRLHALDPDRCIHLCQSPAAIDAGVFHNDVAAMGHENLVVHHSEAYAPAGALSAALTQADIEDAQVVVLPAETLSLDDAVRNSQVLRTAQGQRVLLAPVECQTHAAAQAAIDQHLRASGVIDHVEYVDLRQSMRNGGGPACLRLRVWLSDAELRAVHGPCLLDHARLQQLKAWAERYYRPHLDAADLACPALLREGQQALDALTQILDLGDDFYPFQR
ncbi:MAG: N-succinylarginine dihydrolase [Polyangiales bacterium]